MSKSETHGCEEAKESAEKENPTIQEKANRVTKQMETPQIRESGRISYTDKGIDVPVVSQRQVSNSPDRPQAVEIHTAQFVDTEGSSIAKVHQAQLGEEINPGDHAKTSSDDPEGAGKKVFDPKMNKAEAQLNRVRSSADTGSSERRADSVQKSLNAPGRAKHLERCLSR